MTETERQKRFIRRYERLQKLVELDAPEFILQEAMRLLLEVWPHEYVH